MTADGADGASSVGLRKITKHLSACGPCRVRKVKCNLGPDSSVCDRCLSSRKQCLFRIDDIGSKSRGQRFVHLQPSGEGASRIKKRPKKCRKSSCKESLTRQKKAPSASQGEQDESEDQGEVERFDTATGSSATKKHKTEAGKSIELSTLSTQEGGEPNAPNKSNSTPVSNCVARPTNLAVPRSVSSLNAPSWSAQVPGIHGPPSLPCFAYPFPVGYTPPRRQQCVPSNHLSYASIEGGASYDPSPYGPYPTAIPADAYAQQPRLPEGGWYGYPQPTIQSLYAMSPPVGARAPSRYPRHPQALPSAYGQVLFQPSRVEPPAPAMEVQPNGSASGGGGGGMPPLAMPANSPYHGVAKRVSVGGRSSGARGANAGSPGDRIGCPLIPMAFLALREAGHSERPLPPRIADAERRSTVSVSRLERSYSPGPSSSAQTPLNATSHNVVGRGTSSNGEGGASLTDLTDTASNEAAPGHNAGSQASKGSTGKKTSLVVPFFRWFGMTANTPGYRRIKVAVNPDLPTDEDSIQPGDQEEDDDEAQGQDASGARRGKLTAANLGGAASRNANNADTSLSALSPLDNATADGHKAHSTPRAIPSETSRGRPPSNSHRPFAALEHESIASSSTRDLFDPSRPRYPRKDVLIHLSELFVKQFRTNLCPWVREEELISGARDASLPSILANSICAMTARFSDWVELKRKTPKNAGEPFSQMAKTLIVPMLSWPSLDVIEALILLSYAEFGAGSDSGLWMYSGMGMRMAMDLGIQHESTIQSLPTLAEQEKARWLFWAGCYSIDRITCFGTGRPVTMMEHAIDCCPPTAAPDSDVFYASQIIQILLRRGRMGELLNRKDDNFKMSDKKAKLSEMWQECAAYFQALPSSCAFSVQSFKRAATQNRGAAFLFLHVLFQSTISLLERPGLMRGREMESISFATSGVMHISASASRSIVDMINLANQVDPKSFHASPYLDQLILPTGRAFIQEREAIKEAMRQCGYHPGQSRQSSPTRGAGRGMDERLHQLIQMRKSISDNLSNCSTWLSGLAHYWGGTSWPARALEQEVAGEAIVVPDVRDDDAMQAPLWDMELLSSWAKAKMRQAKGHMAARRGSAQVLAGPFGDMPQGLGSPAAANNIADLLAAANAVSRPGGGGANGFDGSVLGSDDDPWGLALSDQMATSAEIHIQALVNAWAEEQAWTQMPVARTSHMAEQIQQHQQHPQQEHQQNELPGSQRLWADPPTPSLPAGHTPSASAIGQALMSLEGLSPMDNLPSMNFHALELEQMLSTEMGKGSGDDLFPLELPVAEFPGPSQPSISSALFASH